jgi:hypothetical protein
MNGLGEAFIRLLMQPLYSIEVMWFRSFPNFWRFMYFLAFFCSYGQRARNLRLMTRYIRQERLARRLEHRVQGVDTVTGEAVAIRNSSLRRDCRKQKSARPADHTPNVCRIFDFFQEGRSTASLWNWSMAEI